jgi:YHS domain-containing protein
MNFFKTLFITGLAAVFALALSLSAAGPNQDSGMKMAGSTKADTKGAVIQTLKGPQVKVGEKTVCPVTGTAFKVTDKSLYTVIDGKKYYVCCSGCTDPLKKNPKKYLK